MPYKTFGFTEDQVLMRDNVLRLLERVFPSEAIHDHEVRSAYPHHAHAELARAGWFAFPFEEKYGGANCSHKDLTVLLEALAYHHKGLSTAYLGPTIYGGTALRHAGSEEHKSTYIPQIIAGKIQMAICYTEPSSGSDAAGIRTRAVRDGDDYIITGQKVFITNAHVADLMVVSAKTNPDAGRRGLSMFLVDAKSAGIQVRNLDPLGSRTTLINEVFFDDVRVPASNLLGAENEGWKLLMRGLNMERLVLAAASCGQALKVIEIAKAFAKERKAFGKSLTEYQVISHRLAEMQMLTESARAMTFHTADMLDAGVNAVMETATAKTVAAENAWKVADLGMSILAGSGYVQGDMQRIFRDARLGPIGGGTSDILRNVVAKEMGP